MKKQPFKEGLNPLPVDERDFQLGSFFSLKKLPESEFVINTLEVKDQMDSDLCSAFAVTTASEVQESEILEPAYQFAKTKELMGEWESWGADLRSACKSAVKFGSLESLHSPYNLTNKDRDFIANWENWGLEHDINAKIHRKKSYFAVSGGNDTFDSIRACMAENFDKEGLVITGAKWRTEWTLAKEGEIPKEYGDFGFGHAFVFVGQILINSEWHLVAQLSNGTSIGDAGFFYFPREVVNKECIYGNYIFLDYSPDEIKHLQQLDLSIKWLWLARWINNIINYIKEIFD